MAPPDVASMANNDPIACIYMILINRLMAVRTS
jgi:hypothetical protein